MRVFRYETTKAELLAPSEQPKIFLAGPTVRAHQTHLTSWRKECVEIFEKLGFQGDIIIPEFTNRGAVDLDKNGIVEWEFVGLQEADCILFWVARTEECIGLTTNYELGYWVARNRSKVVYGRPDDAHRTAYSDIMWKLDAVAGNNTDIHNTLEDTVRAAIKIAKANVEAREVEEYLS